MRCFGPRGVRRAIIMPPLMLRPSPFWIVVASLGSIMPVARAEDPPCPSQIAQLVGAAAQRRRSVRPPRTPAQPRSPSAAAGRATSMSTAAITVRRSAWTAMATLRGQRRGAPGRSARSTPTRSSTTPTNSSMRSDGHIDYQDPLVHVAGAGGSYSASAGRGIPRRAVRAAPARGARLGAGDVAHARGRAQPQGGDLHHLPLERPSHGSIKAEQHRARHAQTRSARGRDAQVDFMGVPLMYLPWVSFPLCSERKSGFLFPSIGNTSTSGLQLSVPYYWNIAPNADFTSQPIRYSKARRRPRRRPALPDRRASAASSTGTTCPTTAPSAAAAAACSFIDLAELPDDLRLTSSAENVSDPRYFEDFSQGPEGASTAFLERRATLSYRDEHWSIDGEAQQYQTIDYTLPSRRPARTHACRASPPTPTTLWDRMRCCTTASTPSWSTSSTPATLEPSRPAGARTSCRGVRSISPVPGISCARPSPGALRSTSSTPAARSSAALALAHAADREPRYRAAVRARQRLARPAQAHPRAAHAVPVRALPRPGPAAGVRHRVAGP